MNEFTRESDRLSRDAKRALDILGGCAFMMLFSPVFFVIAGMVLLMDGAPVLYRRRVVGPGGEFDAFKFRTMRPDADRMLENDPALQASFATNFKLKADPRVTRLGRILRKLSLDELPQLWNVLCGQMSLVGPRMITPAELEKYGPHKELLLTVKPGLTGYWQVHGRQRVSYAERVQMDVHYIRNWNLRMDFRLLLLTPLRVIRGDGAY